MILWSDANPSKEEYALQSIDLFNHCFLTNILWRCALKCFRILSTLYFPFFKIKLLSLQTGSLVKKKKNEHDIHNLCLVSFISRIYYFCLCYLSTDVSTNDASFILGNLYYKKIWLAKCWLPLLHGNMWERCKSLFCACVTINYNTSFSEVYYFCYKLF